MAAPSAPASSAIVSSTGAPTVVTSSAAAHPSAHQDRGVREHLVLEEEAVERHWAYSAYGAVSDRIFGAVRAMSGRPPPHPRVRWARDEIEDAGHPPTPYCLLDDVIYFSLQSINATNHPLEGEIESKMEHHLQSVVVIKNLLKERRLVSVAVRIDGSNLLYQADGDTSENCDQKIRGGLLQFSHDATADGSMDVQRIVRYLVSLGPIVVEEFDSSRRDVGPALNGLCSNEVQPPSPTYHRAQLPGHNRASMMAAYGRLLRAPMLVSVIGNVSRLSPTAGVAVATAVGALAKAGTPTFGQQIGGILATLVAFVVFGPAATVATAASIATLSFIPRTWNDMVAAIEKDRDPPPTIIAAGFAVAVATSKFGFLLPPPENDSSIIEWAAGVAVSVFAQQARATGTLSDDSLRNLTIIAKLLSLPVVTSDQTAVMYEAWLDAGLSSFGRAIGVESGVAARAARLGRDYAECIMGRTNADRLAPAPKEKGIKMLVLTSLGLHLARETYSVYRENKRVPVEVCLAFAYANADSPVEEVFALWNACLAAAKGNRDRAVEIAFSKLPDEVRPFFVLHREAKAKKRIGHKNPKKGSLYDLEAPMNDDDDDHETRPQYDDMDERQQKAIAMVHTVANRLNFDEDGNPIFKKKGGRDRDGYQREENDEDLLDRAMDELTASFENEDWASGRAQKFEQQLRSIAAGVASRFSKERYGSGPSDAEEFKAVNQAFRGFVGKVIRDVGRGGGRAAGPAVPESCVVAIPDGDLTPEAATTNIARPADLPSALGHVSFLAKGSTTMKCGVVARVTPGLLFPKDIFTDDKFVFPIAGTLTVSNNNAKKAVEIELGRDDCTVGDAVAKGTGWLLIKRCGHPWYGAVASVMPHALAVPNDKSAQVAPLGVAGSALDYLTVGPDGAMCSTTTSVNYNPTNSLVYHSASTREGSCGSVLVKDKMVVAVHIGSQLPPGMAPVKQGAVNVAFLGPTAPSVAEVHAQVVAQARARNQAAIVLPTREAVSLPAATLPAISGIASVADAAAASRSISAEDHTALEKLSCAAAASLASGMVQQGGASGGAAPPSDGSRPPTTSSGTSSDRPSPVPSATSQLYVAPGKPRSRSSRSSKPAAVTTTEPSSQTVGPLAT